MRENSENDEPGCGQPVGKLGNATPSHKWREHLCRVTAQTKSLRKIEDKGIQIAVNSTRDFSDAPKESSQTLGCGVLLTSEQKLPPS